MTECQGCEPRVHRLKREVVIIAPLEVDTLENVLRELGNGMADRTKRRYRLHCINPELMTRTTVIALDQLSLDLRRRSAHFYSLRIEEIKRLIRAAPQSVKTGLKLKSLN